MTETMHAIEIAEGWGPGNLHLRERPRPSPGDGEVLVRMTRASLNYRDWLMISGKYNPRQPLPLVPGSDGVGVVVEVGEGVTRFAVGDRVSPAFFRDWITGPPRHDLLRTSLGGPLDGTLAQFHCAPEHALVAVPDYLTDDEAAALPCAAVTAWSALVTQGNITAGDTVLVQGTGGVSMFALQIARLHGARVIATSSSDEKLVMLRDRFGVTDLVNYRTIPQWGRRVRELSGGGGVDHVVEVGGAGTFDQSVRAVRVGGTISLIGVLAEPSPVNLVPVLMQNIRVQGVIVGPRDAFEALNRAFAHNEIHPHLDRCFPLAQVADAFRHLAAARHTGKITIDLAS